MESKSTGPGSLIGATLGGYEVVALIGRGAMGTVYLARDLKLNRLVALKVLLGSLAKTKSLVDQFHQEAQAAAPLNHPCIVRVYSAGTEKGIPFIVMEYVDGEPLDKFLQRKGKVQWDVALHICTKLAQALEVAHRNGIVHRDIKPSNIMLDKNGGVRLMDFGIASLQADGGGGNSFLGTPQYMSPEQARNGDVGPSSDLYSLGVTLYQMISGVMPFTGESSLALINSICNDDAPRLNISNADVPDDVARFVAYLMGKTPRQRPANAKVVHGMVARLLREKGELNSMSNTITSFIQTEMEASPFSSLYQKQTKFKPGKSREDIMEARETRNRILWRIAKVAMIGIAGIGAYFIGLNSQSVIELDASQEVPSIDTLNIQKVESNLKVLELNRPHYTISDVLWVGDEGKLWLELSGESGSMGHGTVGGVGVDLSAEDGYAVMPPKSPLLSAAVDPVYLDSMQQLSFMQGGIVTTDFVFASATGEQDEVVILSRTWNKSFADPHVLLRIPRSQWEWQEHDNVLGKQYGHVLVHPKGTSHLYVLYDDENEVSFLSEQTMDSSENGYRNPGVARTSASNRVMPGTVQYVPESLEILYWRKRSGIGSELWKLPSESDVINGERILSGVVGDDYALSPDGQLIAVQFDEGQGNAPQIVIANLSTGSIVERLGEGRVSRYGWHPQKNYLVVQQLVFSHGSLNPQLVAINLSDPTQRTVLTNRPGGVDAAYAISPDGHR